MPGISPASVRAPAGEYIDSTNESGAPSKGWMPYFRVFGAGGTAVASGTQADPAYTQSGSLPAGMDRSGATSPTVNTSTTLAAANATRRGLNIQNISANPIGINEFGNAAVIGTAGTYTLAAGATINVRTNRQVNVVSGTASQAYTATEF